MPPAGYFVDTNLLLLFVVGSEDRSLISRHRRLREYTLDDYDRLVALLEEAGQVLVTPHTLTETSNLLGQHREPERALLFARLRTVIEESSEVTVSSVAAASNPNFLRLGLTDAALIEAATSGTPILTMDFDLYLAALDKGPYAAVNFSFLLAN
jgi:predicted nucleic acid-binding protein